ncbi:MAG TPA: hypothetical protein VK700_03565 [Steroidobacteraceae bacterium]|jgi:hypothetical protein|nr:hypothetical protein [Steroidobacteraceae bacterium]
MKPIDYAKAAGIATVVLILDILLAVAVVYAWSIFVVPGHSRTYYQTAGIPLALVSTRIAGTALVFGACWWSARRNPQRNALAFALAVVIGYGLLDGASAGFKGVLTLGFGITMLLKLVAGIAGARLAVNTGRRAT